MSLLLVATTRTLLCNKCRCKYRQELWNKFYPGLGDTAALIFDPIQRVICTESSEGNEMTNLIKPDLKSLVWLAVGFFVAPRVLAMFNK